MEKPILKKLVIVKTCIIAFAWDLENLLDAEESDDEEEGNYESNHENLLGVKGLKVRWLPSQASGRSGK
ncbi:hypothetical protein Tco_0695826 [Tanacetum coccineum]